MVGPPGPHLVGRAVAARGIRATGEDLRHLGRGDAVPVVVDVRSTGGSSRVRDSVGLGKLLT